MWPMPLLSDPVELAVSNRPAVVLSWAVLLAASWTWCIGMYLPVLFVRDFGIAGWVAFTVPNVVGAAAMGWVIRSRAQSRLLVLAHWPMARAFSLVTIAFQVFFAVWLPARLGISGWPIVVAGAAVLALVFLFAAGRSRAGDRAAAVAVTGVSLIVLAWFLGRGGVGIAAGRLPGADLIGLIPVCCLGFALCPYLDLTFHRAAQAMDSRSARISFAIGFGVVFLAMLVLTLLYAGSLGAAIEGRGALSRLMAALLLAHILGQLAFTISVHAREAISSPSPGTPGEGWGEGRPTAANEVGGAHHTESGPSPSLSRCTGRGAIRGNSGGLAIFVGIGFVAALLTIRPAILFGLDSGEWVYRLFMGFYGLVFPAYVWACVVPHFSLPRRPGRRAVAAWILAVAVATPMYWMGFIETRTIWLVPGVVAVLAIPMIVRPGRGGPDSTPHPPVVAQQGA
jgi:hypothetical protein